MNHKSENLLDKTLRMKDGLSDHSTDGAFEGGNEVYRALRSELLSIGEIKPLLPEFIQRYRDLDAFREYMKGKFAHWRERRAFISEHFTPLLDHLEAAPTHPAAGPIDAALKSLDESAVREVWKKAMDRRASDPEGAITAARTLIETACKHVLDELGVRYPDDADPGRLWSLCAEQLHLSPAQHAEQVFKAILGNCQSIVNNLASIRNKVSDAHGKGKRAVRPKGRHAELAVNLAGSMAAFLVATWKERAETQGRGRGAQT